MNTRHIDGIVLSNPGLLRQRGLIGGQWVASDSGNTLPVVDPATDMQIATVPYMGRDETLRAISAANAALPEWSAMPARERARLLRRWSDLIIENQDDLAMLMTREQGKPLAEAKGEVVYAASFIEWFAEEAKRVDGEVLQGQRPGQRMVVLRQPVGVCAAITPWNFPAAMITRKVGPALAAGCTMVVKPSELTPLTALALGVLSQTAGIPAGVLQFVVGDAPAIGSTLCESDVVRKLSFTGSTEVGRKLMAQCAPTIKKLSLELGGNAPLIVFESANIDRAIEGIVASKFRNAGQTCVCANRIYVQASIYDDVAQRLVKAVEAFQLGSGTTPGVTHGPLINKRAVAKVSKHIDDAVTQGASVKIGGQSSELGGTFFSPTVLTGVKSGMLVTTEETFGPLAPLISFDNEEEALTQANDTVFGLAAYIFTEDQRQIWRVSERLEVGMVGVNTGLISNEVAPFGGIKQSGLGREGSRHGIDDYLESKYLCLQD